MLETELEVETRGALPELGSLRAEIERVDDALVQLIAERCRIASSVGEAKRRRGLPLIDPAREAAVVRRASTLARELALEPETVRQLFWLLIRLSRYAQETEA